MTGRVCLDWTGLTWEQMERAARGVDWFPSGIEVEIRVNASVDTVTVQSLLEFGPTLRYLIVGADPTAVGQWVRALNGQGGPRWPDVRPTEDTSAYVADDLARLRRAAS